uniref:SGTA PROTEIN n=1 Tax=Homo sapiens TaxID=9606 RepID=UPI00017BDAE8|nr:Chain A, SGTA PROTEIN [Homo sapiens]2VYI_B Chain B, SGTA PROTEIN [Homo sapiens]
GPLGSEEDSAEAERLKTEGNEQMKVENFEAAVHFYGKAIELNPANAVYFCNRAAAYSKLGNYAGAVQDCERAICIDPAYSKAYGRMGLALSSLNKHVEAVAYYKKALELDPDNETYKSNLKIAELKLREAP